MTVLTCDEQGTARQYFGKYAGIVVDHDDLAPAAGLTPNGRLRGEICVDIPGILEEDANAPDAGRDEQEAAPAQPPPKALRVVAKPSFLPGFFFIPEKDEHVWVEFVAGDIDFPIWTGRWYPDTKSPGTVTNERPTRFQKVIRTASGHVVQLDDTEGKEAVTVRHKGGAQIKVDQDGSVLIANQTNAFLWLNAKDGETTLADENGCYITLKADGAVISSKEGNAFVELKDGKAKLVADGITLAAKEMVLESGSIALGKGASESALLGDTFVTLFATHTHPSGMGPTGTPLPPIQPLPPAAQGKSTVVKVK